MEQVWRILKPLGNIYIILLLWFLTMLNFYLCMKPLNEYATSIGLNRTPVILDAMTYYTPDEGYQALANLGDNGRNAYRWANYADFVLPVLLFLSLSLPNLTFGKEWEYVLGPFLYMITDYLENIAEKYVLEIYPNRNDIVMALACYFGLVKFISLGGSLLILIINGFKWLFQPKKPRKLKRRKPKTE